MNPWFLILCGYLDDPQVFSCFVMVVHESLVCSEQLNWALFFRKILQIPQNLWFFSIFCIFKPFPAVTCMVLRSIFSDWGQLRDSKTTINRGSNVHWCSWRKHDALRALNTFEQNDVIQIVIFFVEKFYLVLPFGSSRRYLDVFRKTNEVQFT